MIVFRFVSVVALALLILAVTPAPGAAQGCCTPGSSPLGGLSGGSLLRGQWELGLWTEGFSLRQGFDGDTKIEDPARRESRVLTVAGYLRLGLHDAVDASFK